MNTALYWEMSFLSLPMLDRPGINWSLGEEFLLLQQRGQISLLDECRLSCFNTGYHEKLSKMSRVLFISLFAWSIDV